MIASIRIVIPFNCHNRLVGSQGVIEVGPMPFGPDQPVLRVRRKGSASWEVVDCRGEGLHCPDYIDRAIADIVSALKEDRESELCARNHIRT